MNNYPSWNDFIKLINQKKISSISAREAHWLDSIFGNDFQFFAERRGVNGCAIIVSGDYNWTNKKYFGFTLMITQPKEFWAICLTDSHMSGDKYSKKTFLLAEAFKTTLQRKGIHGILLVNSQLTWSTDNAA